MISDDIKNDDIPEDDFDLDDNFDDEFDDEILEDDWDGGDDTEDDLGLSIEDNQSSSRPQKSFIQKYFTAIVVAVAILFALIFALGQGFLGGSAPQEKQNVRLVSSEEEDASEPVESLSAAPDLEVADDADNDLEALAPLPTENNALTPLPGDENAESFELVDLDAELSDENDDLEEVSIDDVLATPPLEDSPPVFDNELSLEDELALTDSNNENDVLESDENFDDTASQNEAINTASEDELDIIVEQQNDASSQSSVTSEEISNLTQENTDLLENNAQLKEQLEKRDTTIQTLKNEIAALKQTIEDRVAPAKPAPVQKEKSVEPEPPKEKAEASPRETASVSPTKPKTSRIKWVLRSAQPGKASISAEGSNDLRNIEVGNIVSGLGRIQSISVENGLWVVRGTKGQVTQ